MKVPTCPYCGEDAKLVTGKTIYPHRMDLHENLYWQCKPCGAHVGCHGGGSTPLGRLADPDLRRAKQAAHSAFDALWVYEATKKKTSKNKARSKAYKWLAKELDIDTEQCHIGMFDLDTCDKVVLICSTRRYYHG